MKLNLLHLVNFIIILLIIIIIDDADDRTMQSVEPITTSNTEAREDSSITTHTRLLLFYLQFQMTLQWTKIVFQLSHMKSFLPNNTEVSTSPFNPVGILTTPGLSTLCQKIVPTAFLADSLVCMVTRHSFTLDTQIGNLHEVKKGVYKYIISSKHKDATLSWRQY